MVRGSVSSEVRKRRGGTPAPASAPAVANPRAAPANMHTPKAVSTPPPASPQATLASANAQPPRKTQLLRFPSAAARDAAIEAWMSAHAGPLGTIARHWFEVMRTCGDDVRELLHDGHPTACIDDAAFGYVNAFTSHVNVGFFRGADLPDPHGLLEGTGKLMRHVKLGPGASADPDALAALIACACNDMRKRVAAEAAGADPPPPVAAARRRSRGVTRPKVGRSAAAGTLTS